MSWLNRLRYPRTPEGRKRYIKDSLNSYQCKFPFILLIVIGIAGMILSLVWCFKGTDFKIGNHDTKVWFLVPIEKNLSE